MMLSPPLLVAGLCLVEILALLAATTFPALLPTFLAEWRMSNTEAGWISGIYYGGYVAAVPVLTSLTDRMDARRILFFALGLSAVSALGFAFLASGVWSATLWRCLQGIGLAGTYMPGLKALTDRIPDRMQSRSVAFYTSSFGIGTSLSFLLAGEVSAALDWHWAFIVAAIGAALALLLAIVVLRPAPKPAGQPAGRLLDFRPVLRNRRALGFMLAYMVHNAELFAFRSWVVVFLVFSQAQQAEGAFGVAWRATVIATAINLIGMPASVLTNELAHKFGRPPVLLVVMTFSAVMAVILGFSAGLPFWIVLSLLAVYGYTITADSATITAGAIAAADPAYRGATMAAHSTIGFLGAVVGPIVFGAVLDLGGGEASNIAWGLAFSAMAATVLLGPVFVYALGRPKRSAQP